MHPEPAFPPIPERRQARFESVMRLREDRLTATNRAATKKPEHDAIPSNRIMLEVNA